MTQKELSMKNLAISLTLLSFFAQADTLCRNPKRHIVHDKAVKSTYENCKKNGMTYWYNDKGGIKSKVNFVDGKEEGVYTSYHENGQIKLTVNFTHGQKDGIQKEYYSNGVLGAQVKYIMGKREGVMKEWDQEGNLYSEVYYKNNYKVGLKKYYDKDGNVIKTQEYKMDRNPVMLQLLKSKEKEIKVDLAKYGLMPKDAPKEERFK